MGQQAQGLEDDPEAGLVMAAVIPIHWVTPHRTTGGPFLPPTTQPKPSGRPGPSSLRRGRARLPNPEREVVTGGKLHDVLRW
jgi:hypothetical protein